MSEGPVPVEGGSGTGPAADLVAALGELAEIPAGSEADAGQYKYKYASLGQIMTSVRPILARHNLAVSQPVSSTHEGELLIRTLLMHASGHVFEHDPIGMRMPPNPQQVGSTISYMRRYQLTALLGLAVEDDDGQAASEKGSKKRPANVEPPPPPPIADVQTKKAMALFTELGIKDRKQRLRLTSVIVKREVGSWTDLSGKERNVVIDDLNRRLSAAEVAVRQQDADDQLDKDLLAAAAEDPADPQDVGAARFDLDSDEPRIDSDLDEIHAADRDRGG